MAGRTTGRAELGKLGHTVRLIPPAYVKPFVKRQKNDVADAEAICEAAQRPGMRFVPVKDEAQQANRCCVPGPRPAGAAADAGHRSRTAVSSRSSSIIAYQLLSSSESQDRFDPGGDIQERAEIDARVATKSL